MTGEIHAAPGNSRLKVNNLDEVDNWTGKIPVLMVSQSSENRTNPSNKGAKRLKMNLPLATRKLKNTHFSAMN